MLIIILILLKFSFIQTKESFIEFNDNDIAYVVQKGTLALTKDKANKCTALLPDTNVVLTQNYKNKYKVKYFEDVDCTKEAILNSNQSFYKIISDQSTTSTNANATQSTSETQTNITQATTDTGMNDTGMNEIDINETEMNLN